MNSLSRKVCYNALCETENYLHNTDYEWEGQELKPVALQGSPWTFGSPYMIRLFFIPRSKLIALMRNSMLDKDFFADSLDSIF